MDVQRVNTHVWPGRAERFHAQLRVVRQPGHLPVGKEDCPRGAGRQTAQQVGQRRIVRVRRVAHRQPVEPPFRVRRVANLDRPERVGGVDFGAAAGWNPCQFRPQPGLGARKQRLAVSCVERLHAGRRVQYQHDSGLCCSLEHGPRRGYGQQQQDRQLEEEPGRQTQAAPRPTPAPRRQPLIQKQRGYDYAGMTAP